MAYDAARQRIVLFFGGFGATRYCGDTWVWDGSAWTQVADTGPDPRYFHGMVYDDSRQRVVLFGGFGSAAPGAPTYLGDTWEWDGTEWTQIADTGPSERYMPAMAFDRSRECQVLFGGLFQATWFNDTWEWDDGTGWVKRQDMGPQSIAFPIITYTDNRTVLFASKSGVFVGSGQTWEWDGKLWTQHQDMGPKARNRSALVYDSQRDRVVLFGGATGQALERLGDTWELAIIEQPPE